MSAVDAKPRTWIDVQLPVYDQLIARVDGDVCGEGGVVIDLKLLAARGFDLESLMTAGLDRTVEHRGVEGNLCTAAVAHDVLVQRLVVWNLASPACDDSDKHRDDHRQALHSARACSRLTLPSYSALPRTTAAAPAAATARISSIEEIPPEY